MTDQIEMCVVLNPSYFVGSEASEVLVVFAYALCLRMTCVFEAFFCEDYS